MAESSPYGSIVSEISGIPTDIINGITNGWNGFTDEIKTGFSDFSCLFKPSDDPDCASSSSAGFCSMPASAAASTTSDTAAAASASAAAAYTSDYYASYHASVSSAAAASDTAATDTTTPSTTQQQVNTQPGAQDTTPNPVQSTIPSVQSTPSIQPSSEGSMSFEWAKSNGLVLAALAVFGLALCL